MDSPSMDKFQDLADKDTGAVPITGISIKHQGIGRLAMEKRKQEQLEMEEYFRKQNQNTGESSPKMFDDDEEEEEDGKHFL